MTDIDRILVEQLPALADTLPVPPGRLDAVLARSAERRRRAQQARLTSLTLVVVLVAGLVASRLDSPGKGQVTVSSTNSSLRRGNTGITWRRTDTTDALGWTDSQTAGGALYALSTAPGPADPTARTAPARALYKSDDGVRWTPAATLGGDLFLSDLSARGDRLYGLGTGTASAVTTTGRSVADLTVSWSDDGAKTWKKTALPVDLRAIAAKATTVSVGTPRIAAGPRGVVAVASVNAELDLSTVLPAGVTAPNGYALSDSGVDILGPGSGCPAGSSAQPAGSPSPPTTIRSGTTPATTPGRVQATTCYPARGGTASMVTPQAAQGVVRSFTWAQLGVGGDLLQAVQGGAMAFSSTDGTTFERAALPDGRVGALDLVAGDDGFTLVGLTNAPGKAAAAIVLRSDDGRAWVRSAIPPVPGVPRALGQLDGRVSMVGVGPADPTVSVLGGGGWSTSSLRDALDPGVVEKGSVSLEGAAVGPLGVVAVLSVTPDQIARAGGVTLRASGYTLHVLDHRWAATVTDPSGREVARTDSLQGDDDGSLRFDRATRAITLSDPGTGAELARFDGSPLSEVPNASSRPPVPQRYVVFSRDGTTWSADALQDLVGGPSGSIGNVMVTGTGVIVTVARPDGDAPGPSTVLVGAL